MRRVPGPTMPSGEAPMRGWKCFTASSTASSNTFGSSDPAGTSSRLLQQRDLLVLDAEFQHGSCGDDDHAGLRLFDLAAAELEQLLPKRLELRLVGLEAPEIGSGV